jgi:hypothetical protein
MSAVFTMRSVRALALLIVVLGIMAICAPLVMARTAWRRLRRVGAR